LGIVGFTGDFSAGGQAVQIERTASTEGATYRISSRAQRPASENAATLSGSGRGHVINAAGLNIPGAGKGIETPKDEYIPSFPKLPIAEETPKKDDDPPPADEAEEAKAAKDEVDEADNKEEEAKEGELTPDEQQIVAELKVTDQKVRAHEQAHISAGGSYILGGATFEYEKGPDQKRYAVGGEVSIDSSPIRDNPEATIAKMQVVRAAALAPAEPSAQDRAVASSASMEEGQARAELRDKRAAEARESAESRAQDSDNGQKSRIMTDATAAYTKPNDPQTSQAAINFAA
jgi:hypothetical protein